MDLPVPTDRRDRLLAALLAEDPTLALLRWDAGLAVLLCTGEMRRIVVVTVPPDLPHDRLRTLFSAHVKAVVQGAPPTHIVAVGGGPEVAAALADAAPFVEPVAMGFDHLDAQGALTHVKSHRLPLLERAAARIDEATPIDPQAMADALARGQQLVQAERAVVARLTGRYAVTAAIVAACVVLAGLAWLWSGGLYSLALWPMGANEGHAVRAGEVYRLLASAFLHADGVHLAVNMLALWSLGPMLEAILGPRRYLLLYGASALGGALASAFLGTHSSVGASGAIWGLMTAFLALTLRPKGLLPPLMVAGMKRRVWMPFILNAAYSFKPGVDMLAHAGGGVVGFVLMATVLTDGLVPVEERRTPAEAERRPSPLTGVAAAIVGAAMAVSVVAAIVAGRPWEVGAPPVLQRTTITDTGLVIDLPRALAEKVEASDKADHTLVGFGTLAEAPVAFEVSVTPRSAPVSPESMDALLDDARRVLNEKAPPKWRRTHEAARVTLGERPAVLVEHDLESGVHVKSWFGVLGAREVLVRGYARKDRPASWAGLEEKVAASLREP